MSTPISRFIGEILRQHDPDAGEAFFARERYNHIQNAFNEAAAERQAPDQGEQILNDHHIQNIHHQALNDDHDEERELQAIADHLYQQEQAQHQHRNEAIEPVNEELQRNINGFYSEIEQSEDPCPICLETEVNEATGPFVVHGTDKLHPVHKKCIETWAARNPTCPCCRAAIKPERVTLISDPSSERSPSIREFLVSLGSVITASSIILGAGALGATVGAIAGGLEGAIEGSFSAERASTPPNSSSFQRSLIKTCAFAVPFFSHSITKSVKYAASAMKFAGNVISIFAGP